MRWGWLKRLFTIRIYFNMFGINPAMMCYDLISFTLQLSLLIYFNFYIAKERRGNYRFLFDILLFDRFYYVIDTAREETNYWLMKKKGY